MAYDEKLAARVRDVIGARITEVMMFGGIAFMLNGNMACGVMKDELLVRVPPDQFDKLVKEAGAHPMQMMGGRAPSGFLLVAPTALGGKKLERWVVRGLEVAGYLPPKTSKKRSARGISKSKK